jgi:hypothetical protein
MDRHAGPFRLIPPQRRRLSRANQDDNPKVQDNFTLALAF